MTATSGTGVDMPWDEKITEGLPGPEEMAAEMERVERQFQRTVRSTMRVCYWGGLVMLVCIAIILIGH